jgi:hypothetical protein
MVVSLGMKSVPLPLFRLAMIGCHACVSSSTGAPSAGGSTNTGRHMGSWPPGLEATARLQKCKAGHFSRVRGLLAPLWYWRGCAARLIRQSSRAMLLAASEKIAYLRGAARVK